MSDLLGASDFNFVGYGTAVLVLMAEAFIVVLIIVSLIRLARYLGRAGKEQKLLRIELGKVAEEVSLMREELTAASRGAKHKA